MKSPTEVGAVSLSVVWPRYSPRQVGDKVFGDRRRSSYRFREYLGQEALYQTVRRTAQNEKVGEGLVRRCVADKISRILEAKGAVETPTCRGVCWSR